jgi:hypothetical protein
VWGISPTGRPGSRARTFSKRRDGDQAIWLTLRNITAKRERGAPSWRTAMKQFAILYEDRFTSPKA